VLACRTRDLENEPLHVLTSRPNTCRMPVTPAPSGSRGELSLQPAYFTSSLFVGPLRDDVLTLTHNFAEQYARSQERPFALFKQIWDEQGWVWMHFRVIDARAREIFLKVICRSFLGECLHAHSRP
jgi:hypothetical protein